MASLCSRHPRAVPPEQRGLRLRPCHRDAEALAAGQAQWRRPEGREQVGDVPLGHRASRGLSPLPAHLPAISPYREQGRGASRHVCRLLSADRRYGPPRRSGRRGRPGSRRRWRPRFRALRTPRWRSSLGAVRPSGRAPPASAPPPFAGERALARAAPRSVWATTSGSWDQYSRTSITGARYGYAYTDAHIRYPVSVSADTPPRMSAQPSRPVSARR